METFDPVLDYKRRRALAIRLCVLLCAVLVCVVIISLRLGVMNIQAIQIVGIIFGKLTNTPVSAGAVPGGVSPGLAAIVWELRLPRILCGILAGMGLAVAGAIFQAILQNPLADPYTLGISTGAAFGAALAILLNTTAGFFLPVPLAALAFAALTLMLVLLIAKAGNAGAALGGSVSALIMAGIIISAIFSAGVSFLKMLSGENVGSIVFWLMGSLSARSWGDAALLAAVVPAAVFLAALFSRSLNALSLGSQDAQALGVNVQRTRVLYLLLGAAITAVCVSVCGVIGFIGLIVPHLLRFSVSSDNRILIPLSAVSGGLLLCIADTCARLLGSGEIPVGVLTTLAGGPFFIYLFLRRGGTRLS
jgi:iron complex transport system permease protein